MNTPGTRQRPSACSGRVSRRAALRGLGAGGVALLASPRLRGTSAAHIAARPDGWFAPDATTDVHGQLIVGEGPIYLSHFPMFMLKSPRHPHNFQVIEEVTFEDEILKTYLDDRRQKGSPLYTFKPTEEFAMLNLIAPRTEASRLRTLKGKIVRGHFERKEERQPFDIEWEIITDELSAKVERIVYAHEFQLDAAPLPQLEYVLFGQGENLFFAHRITKAPDFDQVLPVQINGFEFTDKELQQGILIAIPERVNTIAERLRTEDQATGEARRVGTEATFAAGFSIVAGQEMFFEEGELRFPLSDEDFAPTDAEVEAGFGFR
jgi:hypothetical protein